MKIIKIGAVWCTGCIVMKPLFMEIEKENLDLVTKYYDFDENEDILIKEYGDIGNLPCFIFVTNNGEILEKINGEFSKEEILNRIEKYKNQ